MSSPTLSQPLSDRAAAPRAPAACAAPGERCAPAVLVVGNFLSAHGLSRGVCEDLAQRLEQQGWPVLTTSHRRGRIARLWDMLAVAWRKRRQYQLAQVDVFSGPAFRLNEAVCGVLRAAGKPFVLTLHGGDLPDFARQHPRRVRNLLGRAAAVTAPSRYLIEAMRPYRADIEWLPNPLEVAAYPFRERSAPAPRLAWLRSFCHIYNPALAVETLALLADEFPGASLTMYGPDKGDRSLEATQDAARRLGMAERVRIAGSVPKAEVPQRLNEADIFLNTTNFDNTPVSVLEALACGLGVVSTNVGGLPYLLEHGRTALLTPPNDAPALAGAVRQLLRDGELAAALSRAGRAFVAALDWSAVLPRWMNLLSAVCPGGGR